MVAPIIAGKAAERASSAATKALTGDIYVRKWTSVKGKGRKKTVVEHEARVNAVTAAVAAVGVAVTAALGMGALWMAQRKISRKTTEDGDYGHDLILVLDIYDTTYKTVQVEVEPAYDVTHYWKVSELGGVPYEITEAEYNSIPSSTILYWQVIRGVPTLISKETYESLIGTGAIIYTSGVETYTTIEHIDAVYEDKEVVDTPGYAWVKSKRGIPYKKVDSPNYTNVLTQQQLSLGYVWKEEFKTAPLYDKDDKKVGDRVWWRFHTDKKQTYELGERTGFLT